MIGGVFVKFLNNSHRVNFNLIANKSIFTNCDSERIALFYILSGNDDLFEKRHAIFNFSKNHLNFSNFKNTNTDFCSSSKALIRLGLNLFNGYTDRLTNPLIILNCLDLSNYTLAINAIKLRFEYF